MDLASMPPLADRGADELLMPAEVGAYLRKSRHSLESWRRRDEGPPFTRLGDGPRAPIRYPAGALREWLAARTVTPAHPSTGGETPAHAA